MAGAELQLMVFDTRRGNREGGEDDKLLAFHPPACPAVHQSGLAGLLQGLLLFTSNFEPGAGVRAPAGVWGASRVRCSAPPPSCGRADSAYALHLAAQLLPPHFPPLLQRPRWDVAETDSGTWVMHEPEPHLWFAAVSVRPPGSDGCGGVLLHPNGCCCSACGRAAACRELSPKASAPASLQLAPHAWLPRHSTEHGLRALLVQAHRLAGLLCGSVQGLLDQVGGWMGARRAPVGDGR